MKSGKIYNDDEIDIFNFILLLWNGRWILILITFISSLVGYSLNFNKTPSFNVTVPIEFRNPTPFLEFIEINSVLKKNDIYLSNLNPNENINKYNINASTIFYTFLSEFNDYQELIKVLENKKFIIDNTKNLTYGEKQKKLIEYSKSFKLLPQKNNLMLLSFQWHDIENGKDIVQDSINLTLDNIKETIVKDLDKLIIFMQNKNERKINLINIKLNLLEERIEFMENFSKEQQMKILSDYFSVKEKLLMLETDSSIPILNKSIDTIRLVNTENWVKFDLALAENKSNNNSLLFVVFFTVIGFGISIIYILLTHTINIRKKSI